MFLDLSGKRAIVTGGSRGIGRAIVDLLLGEGAEVATCARTCAAIDALLQNKRREGATIHGQAVDVTDSEAFRDFLDASVETLGGLDIFIGNVTTRVASSGLARWDEAYEVDFMQHVRAVEQLTPALCESDSGAVVLIASIASVMAAIMPQEREYGVMKSALIAYTAQVAHRLAASGVRCNSVSPGPVVFPGGFWEQVAQQNPELYRRAAELPALKRHGTPQEVAAAVVFLASPRAAYITGSNLRIDGGALKHTNF